jgi:hypothetical protein
LAKGMTRALQVAEYLANETKVWSELSIWIPIWCKA